MRQDAGVTDPAARPTGRARERRRPIIQAAARRQLASPAPPRAESVQALCVLAPRSAWRRSSPSSTTPPNRGLGGLSFGFLTHAPVPEGVSGGGISTAIVGHGRDRRARLVDGGAGRAFLPPCSSTNAVVTSPGHTLWRRPAHRCALDRHRHLRLRLVGAPPPPLLQPCGVLCPRGFDAPDNDPGRRGGNAHRGGRSLGGRRRARRAALACGPLGRAARSTAGSRDREPPRGLAWRRRDGAAVVHRGRPDAWP